MSGKIFAESANIYQDQAKILFEYYREAAEKIVTEEERLEKEIAVASEYKTQLSNEASKVNLLKNIAFAVMAVSLIALFIILFTSKDSLFVVLSIIAALGAGGFGIKQLLSHNHIDKELVTTDEKMA